jgi:hypothetical protein
MAMGATVCRMRVEVIFCRCWNLVTPSRCAGGSLNCRPAHQAAKSRAHPAGFLESWRAACRWVSISTLIHEDLALPGWQRWCTLPEVDQSKARIHLTGEPSP